MGHDHSEGALRAHSATLALWVTLGLTSLKLGVAFVSGSVGVWSEGIHSALDLLSAMFAFFAVRNAMKPADVGHPYGHGKLEAISSLVESVLLIVAASWIAWESFHHWSHPTQVHYSLWAMGVMLVSIAVNFWIYRHNFHVAQRTESQALRVNALHFLADVVTSVGVLFGLCLLEVTGWLWVDPILALLIACFIFGVALKEVKRAMDELLDTALPAHEIKSIQALLESFEPAILSYQDLKTRKAGPNRHVSVTLLCCGQMSVREAHRLCDLLEAKLQVLFPHVWVLSHVEPCVCQETPVEATFSEKRCVGRVLRKGLSLAFFGVIHFLGILCGGLVSCATLPTPPFRTYAFPKEKAFLSSQEKPSRAYEVLGVVRSKVHYPSLDPLREESFLCQNAFHRSVQQLLEYAQKKGGDAVIQVESVVFLKDGSQERYPTAECADDGAEGQVLTQGIAVRWKKAGANAF